MASPPSAEPYLGNGHLTGSDNVTSFKREAEERHFEKKRSQNISAPACLASCSWFLEQKEKTNMEPPVNWSHEETQALIAVWSEEKIQRDLEESFRNEKVYREVSGRLAAMGMGRSAKQCREKIKKLKQEYRRIKTHGEGSGAVTLKAFRWYDAMDAIMGERRQSDAMISEVMISDVETGKWFKNMSLYKFLLRKCVKDLDSTSCSCLHLPAVYQER